jgi:predicted nucleotidyltransferase
MSFYDNIIRHFNDHSVRYLIVGGIAVNLHGSERTTKDLDIWVDIYSQNLDNLRSAFLDMEYSEQGTNEAIKRLQKGETVIVSDKTDKLMRADVMGLYSNYLPFDTAYEQRKIIKLGIQSANLISLDHLIETKLKAGRDKDLIDARNLSELRKKLGEQDI